MIQLQVINKILDLHDASFLTINNITEEYFSEYKNEFIFIKNHIDTYGVVPDKETFASNFQKFDFINVSEPLDYLIDELYKDRNSRFLASTFNEVRQKVLAGNVEDALKIYSDSSEKLHTAKHLTSIDILKNTEDRFNAYLERGQNFNKYYISTGFLELDEIINGWDRQEELATIVARTNQGKTWILLKSVIAAVEQGLTVGLYSGEMSERKIGYRVDTLISHISNHGLIKGDPTISQKYQAHLKKLQTDKRYRDSSLKVLTPVNINGPAGVMALRAFIEKENLDILFIDQHSLLEDDRKGKTPTEKAANISKDLKNLQVLKKIPIIAVSQQNREKSEDGPDMSNIAQSDRIGQDSTIALFFEQDKVHHLITMSLVKSRDSENNKKLSYAFDFDKGTFEYVSDEEDGLEGRDCNELHEMYDMLEEEDEEEEDEEW